MAKVLPLFLVVILVVAVLFIALLPQQQVANAYVNGDTDIMQYRVADITAFKDIPRIIDRGYKFQFDVSSGYEPFRNLYIWIGTYGLTSEYIDINSGYYGGVLSLSSDVLDMTIEYATSYPYRLELIVGPVYTSTFRIHVLINTEYLGSYNYSVNSSYDEWSIHFLDYNYSPYLYDSWESANSSVLAVHYTSISAHSINVYERSWITDGTYESGYIDGMNNAETSVVSVFPAFIGSILGFFITLASYEVLGISILNILIIAGSLLLLVAILRIFLK